MFKNATIALPLLLAACDATSSTDGFSVALTDAPGDVAHVWVSVREVSLHGGDAPWASAPDTDGLIELTALTGGRTEPLVSDAHPPDGPWEQLRLQLDAAVLETLDGDVFTFGGATHPDGLQATGELRCPSCTTSGLKVKLPDDAPLTVDGTTAILDFDVNRSFGHEAGNSGAWVMRPVVTATLGASAAVSGEVALAPGVSIPECPAGTPRDLSDVVVTLEAPLLGDVWWTAAVTADGDALFPIVAPGLWTPGIASAVEVDGGTLRLEGHADPGQVTLDAGYEAGDVRWTVTAARCD